MNLSKIILTLIVLSLGTAVNIVAQGGADGLGGKPATSKSASKPAPAKTTTVPKKPAGNPVPKAGTGGGADGPGTTFRNSLDGETLIVGYKSESGNVVFTLEAVSDFTNDLNAKDSYSRDSSSIWVGGNKNGKWDCKDFSYATYSMPDVEIPRCNGYKSKATLKTDFIGTSNESRPHPVWVYTIPKSELGGSGIVHIRFECVNNSSKVFGLGIPERGNAPDPGFGNAKRIRIN